MLINADFNRVATSLPKQQQWLKSPQKGVERIMLDRVGAEKARATSFVRYAPQSDFPHHRHPGGEEIFVLAGELHFDGETFLHYSWIRLPTDTPLEMVSGPSVATVYIKTGHLAQVIGLVS
ncbi:cupin domain-containing protein [Psychrobacter sp. VH5]|uniref:cupin domain-containing protein n=1 Tax=Psychrobacter sp. VH5 TaxID=3423439 RepID=UPI003D661D2B